MSCDHRNIANMDYVTGFEPDRRPMVNRLCMKCYQHWYGNADVAVVEFTRANWDAWVEWSYSPGQI